MREIISSQLQSVGTKENSGPATYIRKNSIGLSDVLGSAYDDDGDDDDGGDDGMTMVSSVGGLHCALLIFGYYKYFLTQGLPSLRPSACEQRLRLKNEASGI